MNLEHKPPYSTNSNELNENLIHIYLLDLQILKTKSVEMNLGTLENSKNIRLYKQLNLKEKNEWYFFLQILKSTFAWTYKDLKGIPIKVCQYKIVLEPNTIFISQQHYRMNFKYLLLVKKIDKLLECRFIFLYYLVNVNFL